MDRLLVDLVLMHCPNCGHCPHCGRSGWGVLPFPIVPNPYIPVGPIWIAPPSYPQHTQPTLGGIVPPSYTISVSYS